MVLADKRPQSLMLQGLAFTGRMKRTHMSLSIFHSPSRATLRPETEVLSPVKSGQNSTEGSGRSHFVILMLNN